MSLQTYYQEPAPTGDLVCRAPSSSTTCSGTQTGAQLSYDAERRMNHWQDKPSSPTTQQDVLYDGAGERVEQKVLTSSVTTRTYYLAGGLEEIAANGSTVTTTKYYSVPGVCTVVNVGGTLSYLAQDGLGSMTAALSSTGAVTASALYAPYGGVRYSSGVMPTAKGFTGQQADAATGLDYDHARYYDPLLGQFAEADSDARGGLNRYGYVAGNPETATDPSGHHCVVGDCSGGSNGTGGSGGGSKNPPPPPCTRNCMPGCSEGTLAECEQWLAAQQNAIKDKQGEQDLLWAAMGAIQGIWDFTQLLRDGRKDPVALAIDALSLLGDLLTTVTYLLQYFQTRGVDVSGLNRVISIAGMFVNYLAGPLKAFKSAVGIFAEAARVAVSAGWQAFRDSALFTNPMGVAIFIGQTILGNLDGSQIVAGMLHVLQGRIDQDESDLATLESESTDQFCSANRTQCPGYAY